MKLHRPVAHAGSSGPFDPAGSPGCLGWLAGTIKADRISEDAEYHLVTQFYCTRAGL
jgi:hypothetical protein